MKLTVFYGVMLVVFECSCTSNANFMSPKVAAVLADARFASPIQQVRASTHWSRDHGHGLGIEVCVELSPDDYAQDLEMESEGAARVFAALAESDLSVQWDFVDLRFFTDYGQMQPRSRRVAGVCHAFIKRETFIVLREKKAQASEYRQQWTFVEGYKDQPDSDDLLKW
ncbi:MAG: hypothetical protein JXM70_28480 [Pirellulales bacterium]|nr:hypothetical protein [Pirellulales bacterium]